MQEIHVAPESVLDSVYHFEHPGVPIYNNMYVQVDIRLIAAQRVASLCRVCAASARYDI